jgi:hypothetical protein
MERIANVSQNASKAPKKAIGRNFDDKSNSSGVSRPSNFGNRQQRHQKSFQKD